MNRDVLKDINGEEHFYKNIESFDRHLGQFFEDDEITVFHEIVSLDFHLDVFLINQADHDFNILITSGMSLLKMNVPEGIENPEKYQFCELMVLLPKSIEFDTLYTGKEKNSWIISMLKEAARVPHYNESWLAVGHSLQATADFEPYGEETEFSGCIVLPSVTFDEEFTEFYSEDRQINIYSLFPVYKNELEYKVENGYNKFLDLLIEANTKEILDLERDNLLE
ncbi:suppressor of fused domain protein [Flavobacterium pectinovorum]|uniref:suppressor of fused domain protein n=1 Tax=Flavobacterium pectinovorum TaxID=29533 RepID=UPI001FAD8F1B|nr:suppressor of fused domain protein [Flavobacterium pectinovorum]MCI9843310.1 suppressor of fused domain protein [Flavobacterium pectinovorum]